MEEIETQIIRLLNEASCTLTKEEFDEMSQSIITYCDELFRKL